MNIKRALQVLREDWTANANGEYYVCYASLQDILEALAEPEEKKHKCGLVCPRCGWDSAWNPIPIKPDPIREVYEKYKDKNANAMIAFNEIWQAIKRHCEGK